MMNARITFGAVALALACNAHAALSVGASNYSYAQNFDTLAASGNANPWSNDGTLAGWSLYNGAGAAITAYNAGDGASNAGSLYSFGATGSGERALGGVGSGGAYFGAPAVGAVAGWIAVSFVNGSGAALAGFTLGYDGEQWRNGGNTSAQTMSFEWGLGDSFDTVAAWNRPGGDFDWTSPVIGATAAAVDGNDAGLVAGRGGSIATDWAAGQTLWLRWVDLNDPGNDHGLAIDNVAFTVSAVPEPGAWALMLAGIACVGYLGRRRG
ncbi:MAG: PEP-CTERM sorting domain-containing protein [Burkholderiales bacterium]|nr:PEP-CTERM sorting domain-containing protein [Burkholderiales bacterium]